MPCRTWVQRGTAAAHTGAALQERGVEDAAPYGMRRREYGYAGGQRRPPLRMGDGVRADRVVRPYSMVDGVRADGVVRPYARKTKKAAGTCPRRSV